MAWLDKISLSVLVVVAVLFGLAPFSPQPHLWEKLNMLVNGTLTRPIDIFDLVLHASPSVLVALKLIRMRQRSGTEKPNTAD